MKKTLTFVGRTLLCGLLLCATLFLFMVAVVTIGEQPLVWLASLLGCIICFVSAIGVSLGVFGREKTAPRANIRTATSSGNTSDTVAA